MNMQCNEHDMCMCMCMCMFTRVPGSQSLGSSAQIFAGNLYGTGNGGYSTWMNFDGATEQVCCRL